MRRRRSRQDGLVEVIWDSSMSPRAVLLSSDGGRVVDAIDRFDDLADERPAPPHLRLVDDAVPVSMAALARPRAGRRSRAVGSPPTPHAPSNSPRPQSGDEPTASAQSA
jgi:hypothetical protein